MKADALTEAAVTCFRPVDEPSKPESLAQDVADNLHWDLNDACPSANPSATTTIS